MQRIGGYQRWQVHPIRGPKIIRKVKNNKMKNKYVIDFQGSVQVTAETPEEARNKFWEAVKENKIDMYQELSISVKY